jgi:hypothetical protein
LPARFLPQNRFWELAFQTAHPVQVSHEGTAYKISKLIKPAALIAALQTGQQAVFGESSLKSAVPIG